MVMNIGASAENIMKADQEGYIYPKSQDGPVVLSRPSAIKPVNLTLTSEHESKYDENQYNK